MLKTAISIKEIGEEIKAYLSKQIKVEKIIVYGSYVYGKPEEDSDIDIAVISKDFDGMGILDKIEILSGVSLNIDSRIEAKGFSLKEYAEAPPGSLLELIKHKGKEIV